MAGDPVDKGMPFGSAQGKDWTENTCTRIQGRFSADDNFTSYRAMMSSGGASAN